MEEVSQYIPKKSTAGTLERLMSGLIGKGSVLRITYADEVCRSGDPEEVKREIFTEIVKMLRSVKRIGEPWIT